MSGSEATFYRGLQFAPIGDDAPAMDYIHNLLGTSRSTTVIYAGVHLELYDKLACSDVPLSAKSLATQNSWNEDHTERLLNALTTLGLLQRVSLGDTYGYKNTTAGSYFCKNSEASLFGLDSFMHQFHSNPESFANYVKSGDVYKKEEGKTGQSHHGAHHHHEHGDGHHHHEHADGHHHGEGHHSHGEDEHQGHSIHGVVAEPSACLDSVIVRYKTMSALTQPYLKRLLGALDLSSFKSCVDLGAGSGYVGFAVAQMYPGLHVTLFDLPRVMDLVKKHFTPPDAPKNVTLMGGDFLKTDLPQSDVYILNKVLHDWSEDLIEVLLTRVKDSTNPGGALILYEKCLTEAKDGPAAALVWDIFVMSHGGGHRIRSLFEYERILVKCGFANIQLQQSNDACQTDVIIARKAA